MPIEDGRGNFYFTLEDYSQKDESFTIHKANAIEIARLYGLPSERGLLGFMSGNRTVLYEAYAKKILDCGGWLKFVKKKDGWKLADARFCKTPFCPMCQWRRCLKWRGKFLELIPMIEGKYPTHRWVFLTLTVRNCGLHDLRGVLTHLNGSFNRLSKLKNFPFDGLVKSVEVTRVWDCYHKGIYLGRHGTKWIVQWEWKNRLPLELEPTDEVHPHLHVCGLVPNGYFGGKGYINHAEWTEMWQRSLKVDYTPIVNVKAVKARVTGQLPTPAEFAEDFSADKSGMIQALCETLKYTVKEKDLIGEYCKDDSVNADWLKRLTEQLYKMRRVEYRGVLKEIGKELDEAENSEDLININEKDKEDDGSTLDELKFTWMSVLQKYVESSCTVQ